jgi:Phosphotransferase enzyme family
VARSAYELPETATLARSIRSLLGDAGARLVRREPNARASTFPSEIVYCRTAGGRAVGLFCKYESPASDGSHGHRHGVGYEASIYRDLLDRGKFSTPRLYGFWSAPGAVRGWLVTEYMEDTRPVSKAAESVSLENAASWVAHYHAAAARQLAARPLAIIGRYDHAYYLGWCQRSAARATREGLDLHWLRRLSEGFRRSLHLLADAAPVPVHGEFYPQNVLVQHGRIRPIDWESVALAPGEIDLASLTEGWPRAVTDSCAAAYARTRWPDGAPAEFQRRLDLARVYLHFRWIGARPGGSVASRSGWRYDDLRAIAERTGFLADS